jgi:hypothetical protein
MNLQTDPDLIPYPLLGMYSELIKIAEKEVPDTSCRGVWGCPPAIKAPQDWGIRGLIETISTVSIK